MNANVYADLSDALVERRSGQFSFLRDLVRANTSDPETLSLAAERVAGLLEQLGLEVERHTAPFDGAPTNLVVRKSFGSGAVLAFVCHLDTVPAGDGWSVDPFGGDIADGKLFGRGSVSGKGHFAAQVFALLALMDIDSGITGAIELHVSFDGERGGLKGSRWLLAEGIVKPDAAIVGGPAQTVVTASTGTMLMEVQVRGKHAPAYSPAGGVDALEAAASALSRLYQFRGSLTAKTSEVPGLGAPSVVVTGIDGGSPDGGVPDMVKFTVDRRLLPDEDPAQVETQLTNLIGGTVAKVSGARCRIRRTLLIPPIVGGSAAAAIKGVIESHLQPTEGEELPVLGVSFDHEGRHYSAQNIPAVLYGAGPLDPVEAGMHGADEHANLDDLRLSTEVLARAALRLLAPGDG